MEKVYPLTSENLENNADENIDNYGYKHQYERIRQLQLEEQGQLEKEEETHRTRLRRQRDKILYTGGFRRLQDKTQVMSATKSGDHRTRLTHTLEVEQIAKSIADTLGLNGDLASAIALGHDVGHTPFGHAAEKKLDELLKKRGGFHHPLQSIKYLWENYELKICDEIYEGILKHDADMFVTEIKDIEMQIEDITGKSGNSYIIEYIKREINTEPSTLESQIVIWADKIAYITHDFEDFYKSVMFNKMLKMDKTQGSEKETRLKELLSNMTENKEILKNLDNFHTRDLIRSLLEKLIDGSDENIKEYFTGFVTDDKEALTRKVKEETRKRISDSNFGKKKKDYLAGLIINFSGDYIKHYFDLRDFLDVNYICSPEVQRSDAKAAKIVETLFYDYSKNYKLLPLELRGKIDKLIPEVDEDDPDHKQIIDRIITDYISTMSDSYAKNTYGDLNSSEDYFNL